MSDLIHGVAEAIRELGFTVKTFGVHTDQASVQFFSIFHPDKTPREKGANGLERRWLKFVVKGSILSLDRGKASEQIVDLMDPESLPLFLSLVAALPYGPFSWPVAKKPIFYDLLELQSYETSDALWMVIRNVYSWMAEEGYDVGMVGDLLFIAPNIPGIMHSSINFYFSEDGQQVTVGCSDVRAEHTFNLKEPDVREQLIVHVQTLVNSHV
jgi:hypothetical protein